MLFTIHEWVRKWVKAIHPRSVSQFTQSQIRVGDIQCNFSLLSWIGIKLYHVYTIMGVSWLWHNHSYSAQTAKICVRSIIFRCLASWTWMLCHTTVFPWPKDVPWPWHKATSPMPRARSQFTHFQNLWLFTGKLDSDGSLYNSCSWPIGVPSP